MIDELVVPNGNVTDYLTSITGVSEKDLKGVTLTQADAQVFSFFWWLFMIAFYTVFMHLGGIESRRKDVPSIVALSVRRNLIPTLIYLAQ